MAGSVGLTFAAKKLSAPGAHCCWMIRTDSKMSVCMTCKTTLGLTRVHDGGICPVRASFWCSQCGCYGHRPAECDDVNHVTRPRNLEDLIPADVRKRWGIETATPIVWPGTYLDIQEREIADINTIEVRYRDGKRDAKIREVMRSLKVSTVHKMDDNITKLREWAVQNGKKVRIIQEK